MKAVSLQTSPRVALVIVCLTLVSCNSKKRSAVSDVSKPPPFSRADFSEITPMLDGSAYAKSSDSRIWYLRGDKAVRVSVTADARQKMPEFSEITAVLDGGAYAVSLESDSGLWYLRAEHAQKVVEVSSFADSDKSPKVAERAFYALYLSERKKRMDAEHRSENNSAPDPGDRDPN